VRELTRTEGSQFRTSPIYILVQIKDTEIYGFAIVNEYGNLETIAIWHENSWKEIENIYNKDKKIYLINLVPIFNENNCVYEYEYGKSNANKIL
jgi:hypothetical protein